MSLRTPILPGQQVTTSMGRRGARGGKPTGQSPKAPLPDHTGTMIKLVEAVRDSGVEKARIARLGERQHKPRLVW